MPVISTIVPVYNTAKYLKRCVDSILNQSFKDIEVILVDDGSTDESPQICDEYARIDPRIKVVHQPNGGVSKARNQGLDLAKGEFVHFVDSDDFLKNCFYEEIYKLSKKIRGNIYCSSILLQDKSGNFKRRLDSSNSKELIVMSRETAIWELLLCEKISYSLCDKIFRRDCLGDLKFNCDISHNEDLLFCYHAFKNADTIIFTSQAYYHYCFNPTSAVRIPFNHKRMTAIDVHEHILCDIESNYNKLYKIARREFYKVVLYTINQMKVDKYNREKDILRLYEIIRHNIIFILFSKMAVGYKILALKYVIRPI